MCAVKAAWGGRGSETMIIEPWLEILAKNDGSDLYLTTGAPPCAKFQGQLNLMLAGYVGHQRANILYDLIGLTGLIFRLPFFRI